MLLCYMCHEWKPEADFAFQSIKTGKRQSHCRACQAKYRRQHYLDNRDAYIEREVKRNEGYRVANRPLVLAYLSEHPCVDCGEADPLVLEFDHRDPATKRSEVTVLAARKPWPIVLAEIAKCDVRCANCHRARTAIQQNWYAHVGNAPQTPTRVPANPDPPVETKVEDVMALRECRSCHERKPITEFSVKNKQNGESGANL